MAKSMRLNPQITAKHVLSQMLHKSLRILQLTNLELSAVVWEEVEKNPLLEMETGACFQPYVDPPVAESCHERVAAQLREAFPRQDRLHEELISALDERGFLAMTPEELAGRLGLSKLQMDEILCVAKTFDPPGIFAANLQESWLLQLERKGLTGGGLYRMVRDAFEDYLAGRWARLKKKFRLTDEAMRSLSSLSTRCSDFAECVAPIYPDLRFIEDGGVWQAELVEGSLPKFRWSQNVPSDVFNDPLVRQFRSEAKWLIRSIQKRKELLLSMGQYLIKKQRPFLEGLEGVPSSILTRELGREFGVHESTIFRAIADKYVETPRGMIEMRRLVSSSAAKKMIQDLIAREERSAPLTDAKLSEVLEKAGYSVARRTIAKYRKELGVQTAAFRISRCGSREREVGSPETGKGANNAH